MDFVEKFWNIIRQSTFEVPGRVNRVMFQNIINNNEPQTYSFFFSQTVRFAFSLHQLLPLEYILRMSLHPFHSLPFFFFLMLPDLLWLNRKSMSAFLLKRLITICTKLLYYSFLMTLSFCIDCCLIVDLWLRYSGVIFTHPQSKAPSGQVCGTEQKAVP